MPLTSLQSRILHLLAGHRDPESYVAGSTPLNRDRPRLSEGIDIFHDREERVAKAAIEDSKTLLANGFEVTWLCREPAVYTAEICSGNECPILNGLSIAIFGFSLPSKTTFSVMCSISLNNPQAVEAPTKR